MKAQFMIVKYDPEYDRTYEVFIQNGEELGKHILACYQITNQIVLGVVSLTVGGAK